MASYDDATLKVTELFCKAILLRMFVYGDCMALVDFIHQSAMGVAEIAKSTNLKGCPNLCIYTVPVKSLDTPTHSRVLLHLYYFLHCRIVKTSKLLNNIWNHVVIKKSVNLLRIGHLKKKNIPPKRTCYGA